MSSSPALTAGAIIFPIDPLDVVPGAPLGRPVRRRRGDDVHGTRPVPGAVVQLAAQGRSIGHPRRRRRRRSPRSVDHPRDGPVADEPAVPGRRRRRRRPRRTVGRCSASRWSDPSPTSTGSSSAIGPARCSSPIRAPTRTLLRTAMEGAERAQGAGQGAPAGPRAAHRRAVGARRPRPADRRPARSPAGRHRPRQHPRHDRRPPSPDHRRRRLDRLRDRRPGRRRTSPPCSPCSITTRPTSTSSPRACRPRSTCSSCSPTSATVPGCSRCSSGCGPRWCSTPPPTSTSRCSRPTRSRRSRPTCWARRTSSGRPAPSSVERLVFISSDKAVRPSNVLGRSKCIGEQLVVARAPAGARWCSVRFGNVIGSRGSVIPTFAAQIASGGPVTVTDPRDDQVLHERARGRDARPPGRRASPRAVRSSCSTSANRSTSSSSPNA